MTRLEFLKSLAAAGAGAFCSGRIFAAPEGWKPPAGARLVLGVMSDTHLRTDYKGEGPARTFPHKYLVSALEYFRSQNVDAVIHCGDMAHRGQIRELEFHRNAWEKVFPGSRLPDGRTVEKLFVSGNHEIDGWRYGNPDSGFKVERAFPDPEERARRIIATDPAAAWERVWGEKYEGVWHKNVKGFDFFGRHYGVEEMEMARLVRKRIGDRMRPFFVLSHVRPHARLNRAMAKYPNALSLFGHWHRSASNWNIMYDWKGANALHVPACAPNGHLALGDDAWITPVQLDGAGVEHAGSSRQGYVMRIYDDMVAIARREFSEGGSLGQDWIMPFGKHDPHPFSKEELKKRIGAPQFRAGAKLAVEKVANAGMSPNANIQSRLETGNIGIGNTGNIAVKIPLADGNPDSRVYAYEIGVAGAEPGKKLLKAVYAAGCNMGIGHEPGAGETVLEIPLAELPAPCARLAVSATPLSSLGTRGAAIETVLELPERKGEGGRTP